MALQGELNNGKKVIHHCAPLVFADAHLAQLSGTAALAWEGVFMKTHESENRPLKLAIVH